MLTDRQKEIISQTVPILQEHGEALTKHMYQRMFSHNPEVLDYFNPAHQAKGTQQRALASAILAYARYIDQPEAVGSAAVMGSAMELIAQKHVSLTITPDLYPIVGENLLASIREVLGEVAAEEVIEAWTAAYEALADIFMAREKQIYNQNEHEYGWRGVREFVVQRREQTSDNIASLYLVPANGGALAAHSPGQYVAIHVRLPNGQNVIRNYSLSNAPGADHYRISVKREMAADGKAPNGVFSNHLHDHIQEGERVRLSPPCGDFTLELPANQRKPLVFLAGGIGITPLLSMLYAALQQSSSTRPVIFIQGALNGRVRPFVEELRALQVRYPNLKVHLRYSHPLAEDRKQGDYDSEGFFDEAMLHELVGETTAAYYFCGPAPMLALVNRLLAARGVSARDRHYEFFGPAQALAA